MNIGSMAQQSYVGTAQQSAALTAVSPDAFGLNSSGAASDAAPASSAAPSGTAGNATLSSQTLQALMDLLQGDPPDSTSAAKPKHHHHHGAPPTAASTAPSTSTASGRLAIWRLASDSLNADMAIKRLAAAALAHKIRPARRLPPCGRR